MPPRTIVVCHGQSLSMWHWKTAVQVGLINWCGNKQLNQGTSRPDQLRTAMFYFRDGNKFHIRWQRTFAIHNIGCRSFNKYVSVQNFMKFLLAVYGLTQTQENKWLSNFIVYFSVLIYMSASLIVPTALPCSSGIRNHNGSGENTL
jgi:hypothetical protein